MYICEFNKIKQNLAKALQEKLHNIFSSEQKKYVLLMGLSTSRSPTPAHQPFVRDSFPLGHTSCDQDQGWVQLRECPMTSSFRI